MTRPLECSLWYCAACSEGGELLCCDGCPAAYHMRCLGGQAQPAPNSEWMCGDCRRVSVCCGPPGGGSGGAFLGREGGGGGLWPKVRVRRMGGGGEGRAAYTCAERGCGRGGDGGAVTAAQPRTTLAALGARRSQHPTCVGVDAWAGGGVERGRVGCGLYLGSTGGGGEGVSSLPTPA
jgi:hypothetical protein